MTIYLLRVCAYKKDFENLGDVYRGRSLIFYSLDEALNTGKEILKYQFAELYETSEYKCVYKKPDDRFINDCIRYIFEVEEFDPEKQKVWQPADDKEYGILENPYCIIWRFDHHGSLKERAFCDKPGRQDIIEGCSGRSYDFRPGDEKPDAGTHFKLGDFVSLKSENNNRIYVIGICPEKRGVYFENYYTCDFINNGLLDHEHIHESELENYSGRVSESMVWLSKFFKNEIKVSAEDSAKIIRGEYVFADGPSYKNIELL